MSHRIREYVGRESAWHGLGTVKGRLLSLQEALVEAKLNFTVEKRQLYYDMNGVEKTPLKGLYTTVRPDTGENFGRAVSEKYSVIQNEDAYAIIADVLAEETEACIETAGLLDYGGVSFIVVKLPQYCNIKGDEIKNYILFTKGHDGLHSLKAKVTPVRVVCHNTLTAALYGKGDSVTVRHTANAADRLKSVWDILGVTSKAIAAVQEAYTILANTHVKDSVYRELINGYFYGDKVLTEKQRKAIEPIYDYAFGHEQNNTAATRGTLFGVYNAVTGWHNNCQRHTCPSSKFEATLDGGYIEKATGLFLKKLMQIASKG